MAKFFLGSVPFGCDNIGDEAILEAIVRTIKENFPKAEICIATAKPQETAKLLGCRAVGLLGFGGLDADGAQTLRAIKGSDVYVWAGATGLSDYPRAALAGLEAAQKFGLKTVVWNVGMDSELNPALFRLGGKKLKICRLLGKIFLGKIDFAKLLESFIQRRMGKRLVRALRKCDIVALRDRQSKEMLETFGKVEHAFVGADSATILSPRGSETGVKDSAALEALMGEGEKIGLCVSAQRPIKSAENLARALDAILENPGRKLFLIAMNPKTDLRQMLPVAEMMKFKDRVFALEGADTPEAAMLCAQRCDAVISSRLHLLILAANVSAAVAGISRGSKIANFLSEFGLKPSGDVNSKDFGALKRDVEALLAGKPAFKKRRDAAYEELAKRYRGAVEKLATLLK